MTRSLFLFLTLAFLPLPICQADVFESFDHPVQFDSTGIGADTFRITETGTYGSSADLVVATFSEGLANGAGIEMEASNRYAHFSVAAGSGFGSGENVLLGIADVPGFGDQGPGGPFGDFFSPDPQNLTNAAGSVEIRQLTPGPTGAVARFIAIDSSDLEVFTNTFGLTGSFSEYQFTAADFTGGDPGFDASQVVGIGVEFFALADGSGNTNEFDFHVDNLSLSIVPEPTGTIFVIAAMLCCFTSRRRKVQ